MTGASTGDETVLAVLDSPEALVGATIDIEPDLMGTMSDAELTDESDDDDDNESGSGRRQSGSNGIGGARRNSFGRARDLENIYLPSTAGLKVSQQVEKTLEQPLDQEVSFVFRNFIVQI